MMDVPEIPEDRPPVGTLVLIDGEEWEVVEYWPSSAGEDGVTLDRADGEDFGLYWTMDMLRKALRTFDEASDITPEKWNYVLGSMKAARS